VNPKKLNTLSQARWKRHQDGTSALQITGINHLREQAFAALQHNLYLTINTCNPRILPSRWAIMSMSAHLPSTDTLWAINGRGNLQTRSWRLQGFLNGLIYHRHRQVRLHRLRNPPRHRHGIDCGTSHTRHVHVSRDLVYIPRPGYHLRTGRGSLRSSHTPSGKSLKERNFVSPILCQG
jgi:hypothetical protein